MATETRPRTTVADSLTECLSLRDDTGEVCSFKSWHDGRHSWEMSAPIVVRAQLQGVHRSTKKGVQIDFGFVDVDLASVSRLFSQTGHMVMVSITLEAEQQALPLE